MPDHTCEPEGALQGVTSRFELRFDAEMESFDCNFFSDLRDQLAAAGRFDSRHIRFGRMRRGSVIVELECNAEGDDCRAALAQLRTGVSPTMDSPSLLSSNDVTSTSMPTWLIAVLAGVGGLLVGATIIVLIVAVFLKHRNKLRQEAGTAAIAADVPMEETSPVVASAAGNVEVVEAVDEDEIPEEVRQAEMQGAEDDSPNSRAAAATGAWEGDTLAIN